MGEANIKIKYTIDNVDYDESFMCVAEQLAVDNLNSDKSLVKNVLSSTGLDQSEIDHIVFVSQKPNGSVATLIKQFFGTSKFIVANDSIYTKGAAIIGGKLSSFICPVTPLSLGIQD